MIAEGLKKLQEIVAEGIKPTEHKLDPHNPRAAHFWNPRTGQMEEFEVMLKPRSHAVSTLASLAAAFERYSHLGEPSVWVRLDKVVVILDDTDGVGSGGDRGDVGDRQNTLALPIVLSPMFETLKNLPTEPKELVHAFRHDLKPSLIVPASFEAVLSHLSWTTVDSATGQFGVTKTTMGRDVTAEMKPKDGTDLPPEITFEFEPFPALAKEVPGTVVVECSVTVDPEEREVHIQPYPGQLDMARAAAVEILRAKLIELLHADASTVFAGTP